jgi:hypothetical protein
MKKSAARNGSKIVKLLRKHLKSDGSQINFSLVAKGPKINSWAIIKYIKGRKSMYDIYLPYSKTLSKDRENLSGKQLLAKLKSLRIGRSISYWLNDEPS